MTGSNCFSDLRLRLISAVVMVIVGLGSIYLGGFAFLVLMSVCAGLMIWETLNLVAKGSPRWVVIGLSVAAALIVARIGYSGSMALVLIPIVPVLGAVLVKAHKGLFLTYGLAILIAVVAMIEFRNSIGLAFTLWLVLVVIAADVGGYFAGKTIGGPKIYPKISPKKTWSGTLGGLFLAAIVGLSFGVGWRFVLLSVFTAAASQFGDVAESAIKRRMGVKDSSHLIPGHGGLLDRFDGLIGALIFVYAYFVVFALPTLGQG